MKGVELLVLRHELEILRRQIVRPKLRMVDSGFAGGGVPRSFDSGERRRRITIYASDHGTRDLHGLETIDASESLPQES